MSTQKLNEFGDEVLSKKPVAVPIHIKRQESFQSSIQLAMMELSRRQHEAGMESLEESVDFDVDDDFNDPLERYFDTPTPYEDNFEPLVPVSHSIEQPIEKQPKIDAKTVVDEQPIEES